MKDRNIKYAEYDYGQPESEKRGLHIRSRSGDHRVTWLAAAFVVLTLGVGAIVAIPGVQKWMDRTNSLADAAFGEEYFPLDECSSKMVDLASLHRYEPMDGVTHLEFEIIMQTRSKGEVSRGMATIDVRNVDWSDPPDRSVNFNARTTSGGLNPSHASQCQFIITTVR